MIDNCTTILVSSYHKEISLEQIFNEVQRQAISEGIWLSPSSVKKRKKKKK